MFRFDRNILDQLAGLTGLGWTVSILGYFVITISARNGFVARLAVEPRTLLYLGGALFITTFGLDRLQRSLSKRDR